MDEQLMNIIQTGNPTAIIACVILYLIIAYQRKETGTKRDQDANMLDYRVSRLEESGGELAKSIKELQESIISLTVTVNRMMASEEAKNGKGNP
jgi:uncharacterized protein YlxW (UPF0749 family)